MSRARDIPAWAVKPRQTGAKLRHIQANSSTEHAVDGKAAYTFGRNGQACDFGVDHKSVSRMHACLAHHSSGGLYLIDLDSRHGAGHLIGSLCFQLGSSLVRLLVSRV